MVKTKKLTLVTFLLFCIVLVIFFVMHARSTQQTVFVDTTYQPTIGRQDAPVTLIIFEDLDCIVCRQFIKEVLPEIEKEYIQPGIVKFTFIPLVMEEKSRDITNAFIEVYRQNPQQFSAFVYLLAEKSLTHTPSVAEIIALASTFSTIDVANIEQSVATNRYAQAIQKNFQIAQSIMNPNIETPAVFLNEVRVPHTSFTQISAKINALINR